MVPLKDNIEPHSGVTLFDCESFDGTARFTVIGNGSLGAKAYGLARLERLIESRIAPSFAETIRLDIPLLAVIATDQFDRFMEQNELLATARSGLSDMALAETFMRAELPAALVRDLRAFLTYIHTPLAIRSSSLLEDTMGEPFAGVYATRIIPNNHQALEDRLQSLMRGIKYVYASTYMKKASDYRTAVWRYSHEEKMAVIVQEVVGTSHGERFYPHLAGVARSYNFYPLGLAHPEDGVVELALGLGKTVVEEGVAWSYSPAFPHVSQPYNTFRDLLKQTQKEFWAIDMTGGMTSPTSSEVDSLKKYPLSCAEQDGVLNLLVSTYRAEDDRVVMGVRGTGPRILNFAPILLGDSPPLTPLLQQLLKECQQALGNLVAIEFAMTLDHDKSEPARLGVLQARPMVASESLAEIPLRNLTGEDVLVASESTLGNGKVDAIDEIVYVRPEVFSVANSRTIVKELETINRRLLSNNKSYLLIGFGRWGSSDASAGIPVNFGQISGARVIVEATLPNVNFMLSQGTHFFHNLSSFRVLYFSVSHTGPYRIDWPWLGKQPVVTESEFVRHVKLPVPLDVKVDGRTGRGVILKSCKQKL